MNVLQIAILVYCLGVVLAFSALTYIANHRDGSIDGPFPQEQTGLVIVILAMMWPIVLATSKFRIGRSKK